MIRFREAEEGDLPAVLALLAGDAAGAEPAETLPVVTADVLAQSLATFRRMRAEAVNRLFVAEDAGGIVATYQIAVLTCISPTAPRRAVVEGVRVAPALRGRGIGAALMADAEARARAEGCTLIQLTTDRRRLRAHGFYLGQGYAQSHLGFRKTLG